MQRKLCADCAQSNLESEPRCWACGGTRFVPAGTPVAGEPTIAAGHLAELTRCWKVAPGAAPGAGWLYAAGGVSCVLFIGSLGFWLGRASAPATPEPLPVMREAVTQPAAFPGNLDLPSLESPPGSALGPQEPPQVSVQTREPRRLFSGPRPLLGPVPPPVAAGRMAARRGPVQVTRMTMPPMGQTTASAPESAAASLPPLTAPPAGSPLFRPAAGTAVVTLRNEAPTVVTIAVEGNGSRTALVAPGGTLPLSLPPGTYTLRATGSDAEPATSVLAVGANQAYSLLIQRRGEGEARALTLREPALDPG